MYYERMTDLMGHTPLFYPKNYCKVVKINTKLLCKLEFLNPAGSVKDRVAAAMIEDAESRGLITEGTTIIEPTSGNTGIGLAAVASSRGYRVILTMPDTMSVERRKLLAMYGAEIVLTEGAKGMQGAVEKAIEIQKNTPNSFIPSQFENPANAEAHKKATAPEIWEDTDGQVDVFVAGVGTGGTITGIGEYLKKKNPNVKIVAVEPASSPLLSQGKSGAHGLQGIGANFVPSVLNRAVIDEILTVTEEEAYTAGRLLAAKEGIFCGISSGAALYAATTLARRPEYANATIVCLLPDTGDRYLSTPYCDVK